MNTQKIISFINITKDIFEKPLMNYGFKMAYKDTDNYFGKIVFTKNEQYIKIIINMHPMDAPPYFNIILGKGNYNSTEADWNSIALWHLKNYILKEKQFTEYFIDSFDNINKLIQCALNDLLKYGSDFLNGNIDVFFKVHKKINKNRITYKSYLSKIKSFKIENS